MQKKRSAPKRKLNKNASRRKVKNAALNSNYTTKVRREFLDFDYIDKLSEKEKEFLNKFVEEEQNASFSKTKKNFNKTKEAQRKIYTNNNKRNNDVFGVTKATGRLLLTGETTPYIEGNREVANDYEDALIDFIDKKSGKS